MMRRTVYQFICAQHAQVLDGRPELVFDDENASWHMNLLTMTCPRMHEVISTLVPCIETWTDRTCDHLHPRPHSNGTPLTTRCNSMTCWNYRHSHMWTKDNAPT